MKKRSVTQAMLSALAFGAVLSAPVHAALCEYVVKNEWNSGFVGAIKITNTDASAISGWAVTWQYSSGNAVTNSWGGSLSGNNPYTATNLSWNGNIGVGQSIEVGFQGSKSTMNSAAETPIVTGAICADAPPVNTAPIADISATPNSGQAPAVVVFSASGSSDADGDSLTYSWNFGDGTTASGVSPTHTFTTAGAYSVVVTVSDGQLTDTASTTVTVTDTTGNNAPMAIASSDVSSGTAPLAVAFDASASTDADNDALSYNWTFGDGATGVGAQPSHTYTTTGAFVATVTVSDGQASDTATVVVSVNDGSGNPERVDNPFRDAVWYVNPEWSAKASAEPGGAAIADISTAVWMDRIGAIAGTGEIMGLRDHLDNALVQGANLFTFVVYDLPNRDCNALASNGELLIANGDMVRYKQEFIDPIASIVSDPAYKDIRIVAIIEVDSLPNLVTNLSVPACQEANGDDGYREGIAYALDALAPFDNVYSYVDVAHSGWLGWDSNFDPAVELISNVVIGTNEGWGSIAGFISNTANYTPTIETYLPDPTLTVSGQPVRSSNFYEWNEYFDEKSFGQAFRQKAIALGAPSTIGMLIDTSRNGWGGSNRPTAVSTSTTLNGYVDESRIDQRFHRGNWCNQAGGIGYKPWADPYVGIDAFVWIKPPGESDGIADPNFEVDPDDPAKQHDPMCDPAASNTDKPSVGTGALPGAPHAGRWHSEAFQLLLQNAYPPANDPAGPPAP
jgi:cellulose 1,4-beta-cellobiosidase